MERTPVSSSNIASIGYDENSSTLEIEFHNGSVYQYFDVSQQVYDQFRHASSLGAFLASNIKGAFRYSRV